MDQSTHRAKQFVFCNDHIALCYIDETYQLPSDIVGCQIACSYYIGEHFGYECYAHQITKTEILPASWQLIPLKSAFEQLAMDWFQVTVRAHQVINWEINHQYCGRCGDATKKITDKFERYCESCQLYFYPKISPAIIVLIRKGDKILLARQANFAKGVYALIAGFVDMGESLEDALHREVAEEVGLKVKNIRYFKSQPWPFPDSLMIAFIADYESGDIQLVDGELEAAGWYHANNLPGLPSSSRSVSRQLIDHYLNELKISGESAGDA